MLKIKKIVKEERGSEILQIVLISGLLLVIIITLFYPQIKEMIESLLNTVTNWFNTKGLEAFKV